MSDRQNGTAIAVINTSEETAELLRTVLTDEGFRPVVSYVIEFKQGEANLEALLEQHDPRAVVWDIALPYEENWRYFQSVDDSGVLNGRGIVLTTTNKRALPFLPTLDETIDGSK